jgi:hypothetical protein
MAITEVQRQVAYAASALGIYLIPAFMASGRKHRNTMPIAALNIMLGWTVLGWIAAFVWSLTDNTE